MSVPPFRNPTAPARANPEPTVLERLLVAIGIYGLDRLDRDQEEQAADISAEPRADRIAALYAHDLPKMARHELISHCNDWSRAQEREYIGRARIALK